MDGGRDSTRIPAHGTPVPPLAPLPPELPAAAMTEYEAALRAQAGYYAGMLERLSPWFRGDPEQQGRRQLDSQRLLSFELTNLAGALDTAASLRDKRCLMILARFLWLPLDTACEFGLMQECAEALLRQADAFDDAEYKAYCLLFAASARRSLGRFAEALQYLDQVWALPVLSPELLAAARLLQGIALAGASRLSEAEAMLLESARIWQAAGDEVGAAEALAQLGTVKRNRGQHVEAYEALSTAAAQFSRLGNVRRQAFALTTLAALLIRMGRMTEAETIYADSLELNRELKNKRGSAVCLAMLGSCQVERKDSAAARATLQEALDLFDDLGLTEESAVAQGNLGLVEVNEKNYTAAEERLQRALALLLATGNKTKLASAHLYLALVSFGKSDYQEARTRLAAAFSIASEFQMVREESLCAALTGALLVQTRQLDVGAMLINAALLNEAELHLGFEQDVQEIIVAAQGVIRETRPQSEECASEALKQAGAPGEWRELLEQALFPGDASAVDLQTDF